LLKKEHNASAVLTVCYTPLQFFSAYGLKRKLKSSSIKTSGEKNWRGHVKKTKRVLFMFCQCRVGCCSCSAAASEFWNAPQLQAAVQPADHRSHRRPGRPTKHLQWTLLCVCVCVCVLFCYIVCLVMDSCQWKEREGVGGLVGYQCLLWLGPKRLLSFSQMAIINEKGESERETMIENDG